VFNSVMRYVIQQLQLEVNDATKAFMQLTIQISFDKNRHIAQKHFEQLVFADQDDGKLFACCKRKPAMKVV
jgi:hypothetical protein